MTVTQCVSCITVPAFMILWNTRGVIIDPTGTQWTMKFLVFLGLSVIELLFLSLTVEALQAVPDLA